MRPTCGVKHPSDPSTRDDGPSRLSKLHLLAVLCQRPEIQSPKPHISNTNSHNLEHSPPFRLLWPQYACTPSGRTMKVFLGTWDLDGGRSFKFQALILGLHKQSGQASDSTVTSRSSDVGICVGTCRGVIHARCEDLRRSRVGPVSQRVALKPNSSVAVEELKLRCHS